MLQGANLVWTKLALDHLRGKRTYWRNRYPENLLSSKRTKLEIRYLKQRSKTTDTEQLRPTLDTERARHPINVTSMDFWILLLEAATQLPVLPALPGWAVLLHELFIWNLWQIYLATGPHQLLAAAVRRDGIWTSGFCSFSGRQNCFFPCKPPPPREDTIQFWRASMRLKFRALFFTINISQDLMLSGLVLRH